MTKKLLLVFLIALITPPFVFSKTYQESYNDGMQSAKEMASELNTKDKINERISKPMTSDDTPMISYGANGVAFEAQLTTSSSKSFLDVFAAPGAAGGITTLIVNQDLDLDGTPDFTYSAPMNVSGVCGNGIISCSPGTWENCLYYTWEAGTDSKITLTQVPDIKSLGGCYCINNSCGSNLVWNNMAQVLGSLGGGIVAAIQKNDPRLTITNVQSSNTQITYYGQRSDAVGDIVQSGSGVNSSGVSNPNAFYSPTNDTLTGPGQLELDAQKTDSTSMGSYLYTSYKRALNPVEGDNCTIKRRIEFDPQGNPVAVLIETCSNVNMALCHIFDETICDYSDNNCITVIRSGSATGLTPLPSITTINDPGNQSWQFTANGSSIAYIQGQTTGTVTNGADVWWSISREFECDTTNSYDTTSEINRLDTIKGSVTNNGNSFSYSDGTGSTPITVTIESTDDISGCETGCKVERSDQNVQAGATANTWDYVHDTSDVVTIYKSCIDDSCPVEAGEVLVKDCQCLNDFGEAASFMQTMETASNDITCSSI